MLETKMTGLIDWIFLGQMFMTAKKPKLNTNFVVNFLDYHSLEVKIHVYRDTKVKDLKQMIIKLDCYPITFKRIVIDKINDVYVDDDDLVYDIVTGSNNTLLCRPKSV